MNAIRSIAACWIAGIVGLLGACGLNTEGGLAGATGAGGAAGHAGMGGQAAAGGASGKGGASGSGGVAGKGGMGGSQPDASDDVGLGGAAGSGGITAQGGATGEGGATAQGGATGEGGATAQGGATSSGGSAGTGGSSTGPETDCTNNADDDADGKADCEDPDCTKEGFVSLPDVPDSAELYWFHERPSTDSAQACPGLVEEMLFDFKPGSLQCDCGCDASTGGECNVPAAKPLVASKAKCDGNTNNESGWGSCHVSIPDSWTIAGLKGAGGTVKTPGSCPPSVANGASTPPEFAKAVDLCPPAKLGKGATAGAVCVAPAPTAYADTACALFDGVVDCASIAGYAHVHTYYEAYSDTRHCEVQGCTCDPAPTTCQANVKFYSDDNCTTLLKEYPTKDTACVPLNPAYSGGAAGSFKGEIDLTLGACVAKGAGTVAGTAAPTGLKTLCCP